MLVSLLGVFDSGNTLGVDDSWYKPKENLNSGLYNPGQKTEKLLDTDGCRLTFGLNIKAGQGIRFDITSSEIDHEWEKAFLKYTRSEDYLQRTGRRLNSQRQIEANPLQHVATYLHVFPSGIGCLERVYSVKAKRFKLISDTLYGYEYAAYNTIQDQDCKLKDKIVGFFTNVSRQGKHRWSWGRSSLSLLSRHQVPDTDFFLYFSRTVAIDAKAWDDPEFDVERPERIVSSDRYTIFSDWNWTWVVVPKPDGLSDLFDYWKYLCIYYSNLDCLTYALENAAEAILADFVHGMDRMRGGRYSLKDLQNLKILIKHFSSSLDFVNAVTSVDVKDLYRFFETHGEVTLKKSRTESLIAQLTEVIGFRESRNQRRLELVVAFIGLVLSAEFLLELLWPNALR